MRKFFLSLLAISMLVVSCGPSQEELTRRRIQGLQEMAELGTVEYTVKKVVKPSKTSTWYKYGERSVKINKEENSISVTLPKARVLSFNMPPEDIKEEFTKVTGLRDKFTPEDKQELLTLAEKDILEDIPNMGILDDAQKNAKLFFTALFAQFGYDKIDIKFE